VLRRAHRVVAVSRWGARALAERGYLPDVRPVAVVPNGIGADWFHPSADRAGGHRDDRARVPGRRPPRAGQGMGRAARRARAPGGAARRTREWAGAGPDRDALVARATELGLAERIETLGWLEPRRRPRAPRGRRRARAAVAA
jgi:hypothetical protein